MFSKKFWSDDYSPGHLFTLCCGFFTRSEPQDSRTTAASDAGGGAAKKAVSDSGTYEQIAGTDPLAKAKSPDSTYGTTEHMDTPPANGQ